MSNVKSLQFVFENCESIKIEEKGIDLFLIDNLKTNLTLNGKKKVADNFMLALNGRAQHYMSEHLFGTSSDPFHRFQVRDVTQIAVEYDDDNTSETIFLNWLDDTAQSDNDCTATQGSWRTQNEELIVYQNNNTKEFNETLELMEHQYPRRES